VHIVHVPNLRDVGGLRTEDGAEILRGRLLRSALPTAKDTVPDGIAWPPALVIDLRSDGEYDAIHPLAHSGARIVNLPLLSALRPDAAPWEDLSGLYLVLLDHASMYLVELVREVATANGATLIHCAAGKDRTGVSIALLLRLVGVPREAIVADYVATTAAEQEISARLRRGAGWRHRAALPPAFFAVAPDAIEGVLDVWDGHEGGVQGWFRGVGGDDDTLERLRRTLIG
jgi:protein-tyrosine phosphatase